MASVREFLDEGQAVLIDAIRLDERHQKLSKMFDQVDFDTATPEELAEMAEVGRDLDNIREVLAVENGELE